MNDSLLEFQRFFLNFYATEYIGVYILNKEFDNVWLSKFKVIIDEFLVNQNSKGAFPSVVDVELQVSRFKDELNELIGSAAFYLNFNAKAREDNRKIFSNFESKVISLGYDCLPRTILTRWGVKPARVDGELSYPFDLAVHPTGVVASLLNTGFLDYLNDNFIEVVNSIPRNVRLNVNFNHETGSQFVKNNFSLLKEKYNNRISNLNGLNDLSSCVFVHHLSNEAMLENLIKSVSNFRRTDGLIRQDLLLVIKTDSDFESLDSLEFDYQGIHVACQYIPLPYEKYVWHEEAHYSSSEGMRFEQKVVEFTTYNMRKYYS